jgi:DNA polymerase (family X)
MIFYEHDQTQGRATVVTEWRGRLAGRRVVRGRERACAAFYAREAAATRAW